MSEVKENKRERFERMKLHRQLPETVKIGTLVEVAGKRGRITGSNSHMNLDVKFDGQEWKSNCHPQWNITYYDARSNVILCYKERKSE